MAARASEKSLRLLLNTFNFSLNHPWNLIYGLASNITCFIKRQKRVFWLLCPNEINAI